MLASNLIISIKIYSFLYAYRDFLIFKVFWRFQLSNKLIMLNIYLLLKVETNRMKINFKE